VNRAWYAARSGARLAAAMVIFELQVRAGALAALLAALGKFRALHAIAGRGLTGSR
jgi:hypothetical protein